MAITKKDIEILKETFATKEDFKGLESKVGGLESKVNSLEFRVNAGFDKVLTGQDKIIKELEKAREDRVFAFAKDKDQDSRLDNLDSRVKKLEAARS
ncbi:hypothetical protein HZC34_05880 [Candidatus Saganbacteria bacterium]|nr:hypothetical protein [Candidatus Saganbacteria bacterium]